MNEAELAEYKALIKTYGPIKDDKYQAFYGITFEEVKTFIGIVIDKEKRNGTPLSTILTKGHECVVDKLTTTKVSEVEDFLTKHFVKK